VGRADDGLRGILREHLGHIGHWVSIETGGTEQGVPDSNVLCRGNPGRECWIECKATSGYAVKFRPGQIGWLFTRWRMGGNSFVFTRRRNVTQRGTSDELYITSGGFVRELSMAGLGGVTHLGIFSGGPSQWEWVKIEDVLRNRR
jgi:hypothetical protein